MHISFESKGDFENIRNWLNKVTHHNPTTSLSQLANEGTRSLQSHTPRATGATASGWKAEVKSSGNVTEIAWTNNSHPEAGVNIAKLIELGHGTGTGGYVPPKPYIKQAMSPVWKDVDKVVKEMIK